MRQYLFFKGCTLPQKYPMLEKLAFEVFPQIGIELIETDEFSCCPDPIQVQGSNQKFWMATAARNICIAEENDLNIITLCNGCVNTLANVNYKLKNNEALRNEVNEILKDIGKEFKGTIEVKHFMQVIKDDIGFDELKTYIKHPLNKLKIAGHPGCHLGMP